jgi:formate dehydrogenase (NADP+) alpha subunit
MTSKERGPVKNIGLTIDGETITVPAGISLLDAADQQGIAIPRLCHHPELKPFGACRLCLVEDEKTGRLMASCVTPVGQDMVINTKSTRVLKHRRNIIRLMIAEHPESCIVCNKGNRCQLRLQAARLGIGETNLDPMLNVRASEKANPFIVRDLSKCILCGKCIRADHELVVVGAIDYNLRGFRSRPATAHNVGLGESNCTFCGTCVSICPTGALSAATSAYVGTPEREADSVCGFCGVGCCLTLGAVGNKVVEVNPSHRADTVNRATLCVRGHFAHDFLNSGKRLTGPLVQKTGENGEAALAPASWEMALDRVATRLLEIKKENGSQSIAFLGSSKCTNEENYLFQKIARVLVGTNNIDNGGYLSGQALLLQFDTATGGRWRKSPLEKLETAEAILVLGADVCNSVPVVSYHLKRASRKGVPLIVVDLRQTELQHFSSLYLQVRPQSDLEFLNGLAALLHQKNGHDSAFLDKHTEGFSILRYALSSLDLDRVCRITGLEMGQFERVIELLKGRRISVVLGQGILQQRYADHAMGALLNLFLITGSLGAGAASFHIAAKENNLIGSMDMGAVPGYLPGRQPLGDERSRKFWEKAWGAPLSPDPGLNLVRMIEKAEAGHLKALYIMGENPLRSLPEPDRVRNALEKIEFLAVQDILETETSRLADVVLPGAAFCEKAGTFTNLEGRIQRVAPVVSPPGHARPDWEILDLLSARLGNGTPYGSVEKIGKEIRQLVPLYAELSPNGQGWLRDADPIGAEAKEQIAFAPIVATEEVGGEADYPFTAILGAKRYHLGSGTRTGHSPRIGALGVSGEIEISPMDAETLGVNDGDPLIVTSRYGALERAIRISKEITPGQLFVPTAAFANTAMSLIGLSDLAGQAAGGWKSCAVKVQKPQLSD